MEQPGLPRASRPGDVPPAAGGRPAAWSPLAVTALPLAACLLLLLLPLALVEMPPLLDYPNHLARVDVLSHLRTDPFLAEHYTVSLKPVPNLLMEAVMLPLAGLLPLYVAGRLYVALCVVLTLASLLVLHRTLFGRWSVWPLCGALFVYNAALLGGFMSFSLGVPLMLIGVALWIGLEGTRRQLPAGAAFALFLYFSHAIVLLAYALCLFGVEATKYAGRDGRPLTVAALGRDALRFAALLAVPALLFASTVGGHLLSSDAAAVGGQEHSPLLIVKEFYWRLKKLTEPHQWGYRLREMLAPVLNYDRRLDAATLLAVVGGLAVAAACGRLRLSRPMLLTAGIFAVGALVVPDPFFGTYFISIRFWLLAALLLVAGTDVRFGAPRAAAAFSVGLLALLAVRTAVLTVNWRNHQDDVADLRRAMEQIDPGSHVLVAWAGEEAGCCIAPGFLAAQPAWRVSLGALPSLIHLPSLVTIERRAYVPTLFSHPGKQPLLVTAPYRDRCMAIHEGVPVDVRLLSRPETATLRDHVEPCPHYLRWREKYDYVLVMFADAFRAAGLRPPPGAVERHRGAVFDLWAVERPAAEP